MIYAETKTPVALAAKLAEYISDPSTIRARVKDHFGRAPSVEHCRNLRQAAVSARTVESRILHDPEWRHVCAKHDGPYYYDVNGYERCQTCRDNQRREDGLRELAHLKRLIALRKERQEQQARQKVAAARVGLVIDYGPVPKTATEILLDKIAEIFSTTVGDLKGKSRTKHLVAARTAFVRIMRLRGFSYPAIGRALGGRDHSTLINLDHSYDIRAKHNALIASTVEALKP